MKTSKMIYIIILLTIIPTIIIIMFPIQEADALPTGDFRITSIDSTIVVLTWNNINDALHYNIHMERDNGDLSIRFISDDPSRTVSVYHVGNEGDVIVYAFTAYDTDWNLVGEHTVEVTVPANQVPTVNAGHDKTKYGNERIRLKATANDEHPEDLTYLWTEINGNDIRMECITCDTLSLKAPDTDVTKTFNFRVVVTDLNGASAEDIVTLTVLPTLNGSPVADPGRDISLNELETRTLNGSQSHDSDGDIVSYSWRQVSGSTVPLSDANISSPTFTAPSVSQDSMFAYDLTVTDNDGDSATKRVKISVLNVENSPPTADAGEDQHVLSGNLVTLDGSHTYDDDNTVGDLTYTWTQTVGTVVELSATDVSSPTFVVPTLTNNEVFTFVLKVEDSLGGIDMDLTNVIVANIEHPIADAGSFILGTEYEKITLDGTGSTVDADGTPSYRWDIVNSTSGFLDTLHGEMVTLTLPHTSDYIRVSYMLTVSDNYLTSTDVVEVFVDPNTSPTSTIYLRPTTNQVDAGSIVTLRGIAGDTNGVDTISYDITQTSGPTVNLVEVSNEKGTSETLTLIREITAPYVIEITELEFRLTVTDHVGEQSTSHITLTVVPNRSLIADAGDTMTVTPNNMVVLSGTGIDTNGSSQGLSYEWQTDADVSINPGHDGTATFTSPTENGSYEFVLYVTDGFNTASDTVTIIVRANDYLPVVNAGNDIRTTQGNTVVINGMVRDRDGADTVTSEWTQTRGTMISIDDPTNTKLTFTAPAVNSETTLTFKLTGMDGLNTVSDYIDVVVEPANRPVSITSFPEDQTVASWKTVVLSATAIDDDDSVRYKWTHVSGPRVNILNSNTAEASFNTPNVSSEQDIVIRLKVTAGDEVIMQDVTITVIPAERHSITTDTEYHRVGVGDVASIDITVDNPAGYDLSYKWRYFSGSADLTAQEEADLLEILKTTTTNLSFRVTDADTVMVFLYHVTGGDHRETGFIYVDSS